MAAFAAMSGCDTAPVGLPTRSLATDLAAARASVAAGSAATLAPTAACDNDSVLECISTFAHVRRTAATSAVGFGTRDRSRVSAAIEAACSIRPLSTHKHRQLLA